MFVAQEPVVAASCLIGGVGMNPNSICIDPFLTDRKIDRILILINDLVRDLTSFWKPSSNLWFEDIEMTDPNVYKGTSRFGIAISRVWLRSWNCDSVLYWNDRCGFFLFSH